jgi:hypothetical protein
VKYLRNGWLQIRNQRRKYFRLWIQVWDEITWWGKNTGQNWLNCLFQGTGVRDFGLTSFLVDRHQMGTGVMASIILKFRLQTAEIFKNLHKSSCLIRLEPCPKPTWFGYQRCQRKLWCSYYNSWKIGWHPTPLMSYPQWCLRRRISTFGDTADAAEKINSLKSVVPERRCWCCDSSETSKAMLGSSHEL